MAFELRKIDGATFADITWMLQQAIQNSRFTAEIKTHRNKITIHQVRLRESKSYCGNHPYPCPVPLFGGERPHRKGKWLEGADWVAWNDMLNDTLDDLGVSADVASTLVIIRKGRKRCIRYDGYSRGFAAYEWVKDSGYFKDMIGKPHEVSDYPEGTPGIDSYTLEKGTT